LQEIHYIPAGGALRLKGFPGDIVSLIPLAGDAKGITTSGLEYPLNRETLYVGSTRGVSNRLLDVEGSISLKEGILLCTIIHQKDQGT
jgi:thiamine pyrophosphokinase